MTEKTDQQPESKPPVEPESSEADRPASIDSATDASTDSPVEPPTEPSADVPIEPRTDSQSDAATEAADDPEADELRSTSNEPVQQAPEAVEPAAEPEPLPAPRRSNGVMVWFVMLIALLACGGVGYLYYELMVQDPQADLRAQMQTIEGRSATARSALDELRAALNARMAESDAAQQQALTEAQTRLDERLQTTEAGIAGALSEAMNAAPPSEREWKLAEASYLLRVANHRLIMERDARTALTMLEATDQILAELDDFSLFAVRAALADEMLALRRVRGADVQGLYLSIEAIKGQLSTLPIAVPEYLAAGPEPEAGGATDDVWDALTERFFSLFSFRTVGREGVRPLLSPDEKAYLEQNIRLTLEQAQLAALKRHQSVYETSLTNAREWVAAYLAGDSQDVRDFSEALDELLLVDLEQPLPDISGSFAALNDVLRGVAEPTGEAPE